MSTPTSISIPKLRADVRGQVIGPDDAEYDQARAVFYGGFDLHPAVSSGSPTRWTSPA